MQTGSSETIIGWKSGKTTYGLGIGIGSLKEGKALPRGSKPVFIKKDMGAINEQQRYFNEWPISYSYIGEVDSIQTSLELHFTLQQ
jgi:hypothetical protein